MRCEKIERWVSDDLAGSLRPKTRRRLESHFSACPVCREYGRKARKIQAESVRLEGPPVSIEHLEALSARIMGELRLASRGRRAGRDSASIWRWVRLAASAAVALVIGVFLIRGRGEEPPDDVFSFEGCFDRVDREIAADPALAAVFNGFLIESLAEEEGAFLALDDPNTWNEPSFWEGLSDDELKLIEEEVKKEIRS